MKKLLPILAIIVLTVGVMGVAFASAADLTVKGGTIQGGMDEDLKLFESAWVTEWMLDPDECGVVEGVKITFLAAAPPVDLGPELDDFTVHVCLTHDGDVIAEGTTDLDSSDLIWGPVAEKYRVENVEVYVDGVEDILACQVTDIHIIVEGSINSGDDYVCPAPTPL